MKKALVTTVLLATVLTAQAKEIWVSKTQEGGEIVLTFDRTAACGEALWWMYIIGRNNQLYTGCWGALNGKVMVRFDDGDRRAYDPDGFVKREVK